MPRPSKKAERRDEILDGVEVCFARYGVEGTTLDEISQVSGLARPLIRHNLGNRDEILAAAIDRYLERSHAEMDALQSLSGSPENPEAVIDLLFTSESDQSLSVLVAQALTIAAASNANLAKQLRKWTDSFVTMIATLLQRSAPTAQAADCEEIAVGIANIYFSVESFAPLNPDPIYVQSSIKSAKRLAQMLTQ